MKKTKNTKKFEPVLILENKLEADRRIQKEINGADKINVELEFFNSMPSLTALSSLEEITDMIRNTKAALDKNVLTSLKDSFNGKFQPNPEQLAKLFNVPYDEIITRIGSIGPTSFNYYAEKDGLLFVSDDCKEAIRENYRSYANSEEEFNALQVQQRLADALNEYYEKFRPGFIDTVKAGEIREQFNLKGGPGNEAGTVRFRDDIGHVKRLLRDNGVNDSHERYKEIFKS